MVGMVQKMKMMDFGDGSQTLNAATQMRALRHPACWRCRVMPRRFETRRIGRIAWTEDALGTCRAVVAPERSPGFRLRAAG